ncbi:MAG TPA: hypothetical protein PLD88_14390, partial [Candidatus Berkiella sp.]|nr:hypothetical protein [Candidatus Berkiella sp.]
MKHHVEIPTPYSMRLEGGFQISYQFCLLLLLSVMIIALSALWGGYQLAVVKMAKQVTSIATESRPHKIDELTEQHLQVLTQHIGRIEANLMRINALGERLVLSAHLDPQEFDFSHDVPVGGSFMQENTHEELLATIHQLNAMLDKRYAQLM